MADPLTVALVTGGLTATQAIQGNSAAKEARDQQIASENIQANQRRSVTGRNLAGVLGSVRASAAGRGVAGSASVIAQALSEIETGENEKSSIELNRTLGIAQAQSQYAAQYTNPLISGLVSGLVSYVAAGGEFGGGSGTPFVPGTSEAAFGVTPNIHSLGTSSSFGVTT